MESHQAGKTPIAPSITTQEPFDRLVRDIDDVSKALAPTVFADAAIARFLLFREEIRELQQGRVRLTSLSLMRSAAFDMFRTVARRARDYGCFDRDYDHSMAGTYRSAAYLCTNDYFRMPFIQQLTIQRDLAIAAIIPDVDERRKRCRMQRVIVVPSSLPARSAKEKRQWWAPILADLEDLGDCDSTWIVNEERLRELHCAGPDLDFGLYSDVAVGIYKATPNGEELLLQESASESFRDCEATWRSFFHEKVQPLSLGEFRNRLEAGDVR